eukprot:2468510-Pyramimonas_sp.AAC.1
MTLHILTVKMRFRCFLRSLGASESKVTAPAAGQNNSLQYFAVGVERSTTAEHYQWWLSSSVCAWRWRQLQILRAFMPWCS